MLETALQILRANGAILADPVELTGADQMSEPEFAALKHEFKHDLNAYLRRRCPVIIPLTWPN